MRSFSEDSLPAMLMVISGVLRGRPPKKVRSLVGDFSEMIED